MNLKEPFLLVTEATAAPQGNNNRFVICLCIGLALGVCSFLVFPFSIAAFGALYSIASLIVMGSTLFVASPRQQFENLKEKNRGVCFAVYLATIFLTLFFALYPGIWFRSILVFLSVFVQCCALAWYCLSYFPRVQAGLRAAAMYFW